eukprot:2562228-Pyramimonas_sp.AAC.1
MPRRLRAQGITHDIAFNDMFNASGSSTWDQLGTAVFLHSRGYEHALCKQRYNNAINSPDTSEGPPSQFDLGRGTRLGILLLAEPLWAHSHARFCYGGMASPELMCSQSDCEHSGMGSRPL